MLNFTVADPGRRWRACVLLVVVLAAADARGAARLLGIGGGSDARLYDIDTATGAVTNPRPTGLSIVSGITFGPDGTLYGLTTGASSPADSLVRIDVASGAATAVGPAGLHVFEGDLRFNPKTGVLYGLADAPEAPYGPRRVFSVDPSTGHATVVATLWDGFSDLSGLAFSPDGVAYVFDTDGFLLSYRPDWTLRSRTALTITGGGHGLGIVGSIDFDPATGVLYLADGYLTGSNSLYTVNPGSGEMRRVGPLGPLAPDGLSGLAFVPEPSAAALLAAALLLLRRGARGPCMRRGNRDHRKAYVSGEGRAGVNRRASDCRNEA